MDIIEVDPPASLPMMLGANVSFLIAKLLPLTLFSDTKSKSYPLDMYMSICEEIVCYAQIVEFPQVYQIPLRKQRAFIQAPSL